MKMNFKARAEMVKAMDTIMKAVNDEAVLEPWLVFGVADGDILEDTTDDDLEDYCEDDTFAELMGLFLHLMAKAKKSGGLYCDGIIDK